MGGRDLLCVAVLSALLAVGHGGPPGPWPHQHTSFPQFPSPPCSPPTPCFDHQLPKFSPPVFNPHIKPFLPPNLFPQPRVPPLPFPHFHPSPFPRPFPHPHPFPFPIPGPGQRPQRPNLPDPFGSDERPVIGVGPPPDPGTFPGQRPVPEGRPDIGFYPRPYPFPIPGPGRRPQLPNDPEPVGSDERPVIGPPDPERPDFGSIPDPETDIDEERIPQPDQGSVPNPNQGTNPESGLRPEPGSVENGDEDQLEPFDNYARNPSNPSRDLSLDFFKPPNRNVNSGSHGGAGLDQNQVPVQSFDSNQGSISFPGSVPDQSLDPDQSPDPDQSSNQRPELPDPNDVPPWAVRVDASDVTRSAKSSGEPALRRKTSSVLLAPPVQLGCPDGQKSDFEGRCREMWGR